jgi:O-Antigen ligase
VAAGGTAAIALMPSSAGAAAPARPQSQAVPRYTVGFFLFLLANAALFIRPGEIVPELVGWSIYEFLILACFAASFSAVLAQFTPKALEEQPVTVCVLGLLLAVLLSHLASLDLPGALSYGYDFAKMAAYFMLFVGLVNTPARLRTFLFCMTAFATVAVLLAVLQYHGFVTLPNLKQVVEGTVDAATGKNDQIVRLTGSGIFGDPNEVGVLIAMLILPALYWLTDRRSGALRFLWLGPVALFCYAIILTQSRGALLALAGGMAVLVIARFGWRIALLLGAIAAPVALLFLVGRQTDLSTGHGTAQERIQFWSDALVAWRGAPLFGVGREAFVQQEEHVAHNSYLQIFVDLGAFGGMFFLGAFYLAAENLWRLGDRRRHAPLDPEAARMQPYIFGLLAAWAAGMTSLTLCYILPTYTVLALATAYSRTTPVSPALPVRRFNFQLLGRLLAVAIVGLGMLYLFVRISLVR